jgi:hypothetical protein
MSDRPTMSDGPTRDVPPDDGAPPPEPPPVFRHPQWMVGIVLILGIAAIFAGLDNPVWFVIGFPCILVLVIYLWVRIVGPR